MFGLLFAAIAGGVGYMLGSLLGGLVGVVFELLSALFAMLVGLVSLIVPSVRFRNRLMKNPSEVFERAVNNIEVDPDSLWEWPLAVDLSLRARRKLIELAEMDYPRAAASLGHAYKDGYGGFRNYKKAAYWLQRAVDNGDVTYVGFQYDKYDAYVDLAYLYVYGKGVEQNPTKALALLEKTRSYGKVVNDLKFMANYVIKKGK